MRKDVKIILLASIFVLATGLLSFTSANDADNTEPEITAQDLNLKEPKLLPDSPFYFLKNWGRTIQLALTLDNVKKAELKQKFSDERLLELRKIVENNASSEAIQKAIENYKKELEKTKDQVDKIKDKAEASDKVDKFLDKVTHQRLLHEKILEKLEGQVPADVLEKIKEARENHLEKFAQVMAKLSDNADTIKEKLESALENQKGGQFKNFNNLEVLLRIEEKLPEKAREAIKQAQENALKRLHGDLEQMSPEDQEKFKQFLEDTSDAKEERLELLENIRAGVNDNPILQQKLLEAREKILGRVEEKNENKGCPVLEKPAVSFCPNGRIIPQNDNQECIVSFKCVVPADNISPSPTPNPGQRLCVTVWDPVCGKDNKTYSNACYAGLAGIEIAYKGECGLTCKTDYDCPQLKLNCAPTNTTIIATKCQDLKSVCQNGKCALIRTSQ